MGAVDDDQQTNGGDLEVANNIPLADVNNNQDEYEYGEYDEEEEENASPAKKSASQVTEKTAQVKLEVAVKPTAKIEVPPS